MGEKGYNRTLGKSGKRYPKGFRYPTSEYESPVGADLEPPRCRRIDCKSLSRTPYYMYIAIRIEDKG